MNIASRSNSTKVRVAVWARIAAGLLGASFPISYGVGLVMLLAGRSKPQIDMLLLWTAPLALGFSWLLGYVALTGEEPRNLQRMLGWFLILGIIWFVGLIGP